MTLWSSSGPKPGGRAPNMLCPRAPTASAHRSTSASVRVMRPYYARRRPDVWSLFRIGRALLLDVLELGAELLRRVVHVLVALAGTLRVGLLFELVDRRLPGAPGVEARVRRVVPAR